ncbi:SAM-dependent methyltransferase [Nocardia stercoris]|uniref:SAM-dependent methyltransferase n=1 Tax=Nocardia stercoris TaxID=2483361 RepID=A0A3M2L5E0_9NOCA|nr:SAM-dependent methyltransferase [Nocardia stercoris]RMI31930.1 SAM-dependent methyltransferase [Nocardia stercoris]
MSDSDTRATSRLVTEVDTSVPHEARVYDYWLDGRDNYPADRALGDAIAELIPAIATMARANRAFLGRAVRYVIDDLGITQFLDIGTGIPTAGNTHEIAQQRFPASRVVYVDRDPVVLAHARALMGGTTEGATAFIHADVSDPDSVLGHPALRETLDLDEPVAIMLVAILMYFRPADNPLQIVQRLLDAVPPGSVLVITHPTADFDPQAMAYVVQTSEQSGIPFHPRSKTETEALFAGTQLLDPGVVPVVTWRPDVLSGHAPADSAWYWAGVGMKQG